MDERWQRELTRLRNAPPPPGDLWERVEGGPRLPDASGPDIGRALTISIAVIVTTAVIALAWIVLRPLRGDERTPAAVGLLDVPPLGQVAPGNLDDGRPVFVVHRDDATVEVIDAFSSHVPWGLAKLNVWCPSSRTFDDVFHGSKWNQDGAYLLGPGPTGLVTYETTLEKDGHVLVGSAIAGAPRDAPRTSKVMGAFCQTAATAMFPTLSPAMDSPAAAVQAAPDTWVTVRGSLIQYAKNGAELCNIGARRRSTCTGGVPVVGLQTFPNEGRLHGYIVSGTFIAQPEDGALAHLTRVPKASMTDSG